MKTPSRVKVNLIKKIFENKIEKVRIVTRTPRGRTRRERNLVSHRKKISFSSSEEEPERMSKSPPRDQRKQKGRGQSTEQAKEQQTEMETDMSRKRPRDEDSNLKKDQNTLDFSVVKEILDKGGAGHLFDQISVEIGNIINMALDRQAKSMKRMMEEQRAMELEYDRCSRSILIHNADKLVVEEYDNLIGYTLAEKVTEALHTMCRCMITIVEAFPMGRYVEGKPVTSICIVLGSSRQKAVVYKTIIAHIRRQTNIGKAINRVSLRDVFPKEKVQEAQELARKGLSMKKNGSIEAFKVAAMGTGVIPVLYVKYKYENGNVSYWEVYQDRREQQSEQESRAGGEEPWEQVRSKRRPIPAIQHQEGGESSSFRRSDFEERRSDFPDLHEANPDKQRQRSNKQ